ncbi:MAG: four-helix bundle copper-binding protein [Nitriliruptor sp.]|nr:MAG: four-helix bundle copper-binding protein [Nitriliruptor sp.]
MTLPRIIADADVELAVDGETLARSIDAFLACAAACTACSSACLAEDDVAQLKDCIATNDVCAAICEATATVAARLHKGSWTALRKQLEACLHASRVCADECREHAAQHDHCRGCAEACERAEKAAGMLLEAIPT